MSAPAAGSGLDVGPLVAQVGGALVDGEPTTVEVPADRWLAAVRLAREDLGCRFFDFLTAVDEPEGLRVVCHLARLRPLAHLVLQARLPADAGVTTIAGEYAGAAWCERETAEMFGARFLSESGEELDLPPLLLPPGFAGHPLRKDAWLQARQERPWPGAKEPGESTADVAGSPSRRRLSAPGVRGHDTGGRGG